MVYRVRKRDVLLHHIDFEQPRGLVFQSGADRLEQLFPLRISGDNSFLLLAGCLPIGIFHSQLDGS